MAAKLEAYKKKRDFRKTPEPEPAAKETATGRLFVIQKHDARRLHYDFRLELDGVLLSWAVPKGPSYDPGEKRLAVQVEDHPLDYASFEGIIPEGEYGGGTVMLWDRGQWEPVGDPQKDYKKGKLKFRLHGEKLQGGWTLVRMHGDGEKNWLLVKEKDEAARPESEFDITEAKTQSVSTGRSMDEIAEQRDRVWTDAGEVKGEKTPKAKKVKPKPRRDIDPSSVPKAKKAAQPEEFFPQLATLVKDIPGGDQWLHEIKYDGYRLLCMFSGGDVRLVTRRGNDWTDKFGPVEEAARKLDVDEGILDGELVVLKRDGTTDFQALQNFVKEGVKATLFYYAFDVPWFGGYDLTRSPLIERKKLLHTILEAHLSSSFAIRYSDHIQGDGPLVFQNACEHGLEGLVSKRADSTYEQKRSHHWVKVKCIRRQEFVVVGYTDPGGARANFGALVLGVYDKDKLTYCGRVGTGFTDKTLKSIYKQLSEREQEKTSFDVPPKGAEARGVHWVKPELVAEVEFSGWTSDNYLRHPSFKGIREDKEPREITREEPVPFEEVEEQPTSRRKSAHEEHVRIAGVTLSNPDRVVYPEQGISKRGLAEYYEEVADWILPHIVGRPMMLVRCPKGRHKNCFYQKHINETLPEPIRGIEVMEKGGPTIYIAIDDLAGLIALVQFGALELHPWGSNEKKIEQPDRITFDLDPGPDVPWDAVVTAAHLVRDRLEEAGLRSFVKTTGGKGLHVVAPLKPSRARGGADWDEVKSFTKAIADGIVREDRSRYIATMSKAKRAGKIFVDYLRNSRGATAVAAYSTRARQGAPVATPLRWDELTPDMRPDKYTIQNLPQRLKTLKSDPWDDFFEIRQSLTAVMRKKLGV
ncbi:MAG: DNA ligase D [Candidatus Hydrogenedentes bacterium]|nr:DNA ligase D [Candidatus Hydrogenedentota bacterium]